MKPSLLLVTPPSRSRVYQGLATELAAIEPPVASTLLAERVRREGYGVEILDAEAEGWSPLETAREVVARRSAGREPHGSTLVAFVVYGQQPSASTQCMPGAREVAARVKELAPDLPTIVLGTHASALPERTLREEPYRWVAQGEGLGTILALLQSFEGGRVDEARVPGLWYRVDGGVASSPPAAKLRDLDRELPGQAWDLIELRKYRAHNWHCFDRVDRRSPYASLQTSLGCPFRCTFCCINAPFGSPGIRYWSADHVIGQIDILVRKYGVETLKIPDEMFVLSEPHVAGICERIIERGYRLNLWAYARVDTVRESLLEKLERAGFRWLALGIESGSKLVRDGVRKGRFTETDIEGVVGKLRDHRIRVVGNYIFGLPDDTAESMRATLDLALRLNTEWANFYCAMAYPGSELYRVATERGWRLPDDWLGYSQHAVETLPLPTETVAAGEVLAFRDRAFTEYFESPRYLARLGECFGPAAVEHVRNMTSLRLARKFTAG